jgi:hypothetical protein
MPALQKELHKSGVNLIKLGLFSSDAGTKALGHLAYLLTPNFAIPHLKYLLLIEPF